jgi:hypothetical protein
MCPRRTMRQIRESRERSLAREWFRRRWRPRLLCRPKTGPEHPAHGAPSDPVANALGSARGVARPSARPPFSPAASLSLPSPVHPPPPPPLRRRAVHAHPPVRHPPVRRGLRGRREPPAWPGVSLAGGPASAQGPFSWARRRARAEVLPAGLMGTLRGPDCTGGPDGEADARTTRAHGPGPFPQTT